jgi:DNA-binding response OmpR family regulator
MPAPATPHVLIIDKDEAARQACRRVVEEQGLTCAEAASAKEGAEAATACVPDIVLLADQLPDQPALAVLRKIRQASTSPHQKVIMLISSGEKAVKQILAAGADDYVFKPLDPDQLQARVKTSCQLKEAQDRAERLALQLAAAKAATPPPVEPAPAAKTGLFSKLGGLFGKRR